MVGRLLTSAGHVAACCPDWRGAWGGRADAWVRAFEWRGVGALTPGCGQPGATYVVGTFTWWWWEAE